MKYRWGKILFRPCLLMIFLFLGYSNVSADTRSTFSETSKAKIRNAVLQRQIPILPQLNKLNFGFGRFAKSDFYFTKSISKIFFQNQSIQVKIIEIDFYNSNISMELFNPVLGNGTIEFNFNTDLLSHATDEDVIRILLTTLGDEDNKYVFVNPGSKVYHLYTCNHLIDPKQATRMTLEEAEKNGYKKSGFCFQKILYLPELSMEIAIEREWSKQLSDFLPLMDCSDKQVQLQKLGEKILKKWPFPLLGYDYSFHLINSPKMNAFAVPTGKIFVTSAILDSLENEEELEALLVLAIVHIEKRHSLKQYRAKLAKTENLQQIMNFASAAGSLAGMFAGGIWGSVSSVPLSDETEIPRPLLGFDDDFERQADELAALYFDIYYENRRNLNALIRKLQFNEMSEKFNPDHKEGKSPDFKTRIKTVADSKFLYFGKDKNFITKDKNPIPYQLKLLYQSMLAEENKLDVYITDKTFFDKYEDTDKKQIVYLIIRDKNGDHKFTLDKRFTTEDPWGAFLTFVASSNKENRFLQDVEKIVLKIGADISPGDRHKITRTAHHTFVQEDLEY